MVFEVSVKFLWNWVLQSVNIWHAAEFHSHPFIPRRKIGSIEASWFSLQTECFIAPNKERKEKLQISQGKQNKPILRNCFVQKGNYWAETCRKDAFYRFSWDYTCSSFNVAITRKKKEKKKITSACIWKLACIVWLTLKPITDHKWLEICLWTLNSINLIARWSTEFSGNVAPSSGLLF